MLNMHQLVARSNCWLTHKGPRFCGVFLSIYLLGKIIALLKDEKRISKIMGFIVVLY